MAIEYTCKTFQELSLQELYNIMVLRQTVFVVEQNCVYLDADGLDQKSHHLMGRLENGTLVAYLRILPTGTTYAHYSSIGRVLTAQAIRGKGQGMPLMKKAIRIAEDLYPNQAIKLSAQSHLCHFYARLGFITKGEEYLEDGIPHTAMVREANDSVLVE